MSNVKFLIAVFLFLSFWGTCFADNFESRISTMEETLKTQQKTIEEQQRTIQELKEELNRLKTTEVPAPDEKVPPAEQTPAGSGGLFGGSSLMNPNISLLLNTNGYASSIKESELANRGIPGFTNLGIDRNQGFNLEAAELYFFAPVDPYFNLYATIPVTEDGAEVEEAYFLTTSLPAGLQLKGGKFRSGFGRLNAQHEHVWSFVDAPLAYRAFVGDEGIDEKGLQLTCLPPLPFYMQLGFEALQGENEVLFGPDVGTGPHAFTAFAKASFDIGDNSTMLLGPSVITGKTKTGSIADNTEFTGDSTLYGFEFTYKWKPSKSRSFTLQSEYLLRQQSGDLLDTTLLTSDSLKRTQDGIYLQGIYQVERWGFGARYDLLEVFRDKYVEAENQESFGDKPWRASGEIEFNPSEFSKLRFQYNYDRSGRDGKTNNEFFLQCEFGIGAHGAHTF